MLGEVIGEGSGKVAGVRVLPTEGQEVRVEVSAQGTNKLLGVEMGETITYCQTIRADGVLYGEGHNLMMSKGGEVADWEGFGVGKPVGPAPAAHYAVCGFFRTAPKGLARLTSVATAVEYDVDEQGNYRWKMWEWK